MDEFRNVLSESHPHDLQTIRHYIKWVSFRRMIHNAFYFRAHWIKPTQKQIHWIGRSS